jgi:hypothetical protein
MTDDEPPATETPQPTIGGWIELVFSMVPLFGFITWSFLVFAADQDLRHRLVPEGGSPWDFNGDGAFTISDVGIWWNYITAYPTDMIITSHTGLSQFFELGKIAPLGFFQSAIGMLGWTILLVVISVWIAMFISFVNNKLPQERRGTPPYWLRARD